MIALWLILCRRPMKLVVITSLAWLLFVSLGGAATHELVSDRDADEFAQIALNSFWSNALDEYDRPIQPTDPRDRHVFPIPIAEVHRIARAGAPAGVGQPPYSECCCVIGQGVGVGPRGGRWH